MKKLATFIGLTLLLFTSCNKNNGTSIIAVDAVSIDPVAITMEESQTVLLKAIISPTDAQNNEVAWTSADPSIASVDDNGTVTALRSGQTTITVKTKDGNKTAACDITVVEALISVTGITIEPATRSSLPNASFTITATVLPANASNLSVTWTSSNTSVAEVYEDGTVTAIAVGESTITATTVDGGHTATCVVTVSAQASRPKLPIEYIAEFNVNTDGDGFATSHDNDQSGYFTWSEAKDLFDGSVPALQGYHLPTKNEWLAVGSTALFIQYGSAAAKKDHWVPEEITVKGVTKSYYSQYKNPLDSHISYGMRFQGGGAEANELKCAYRYEPVGTFVEDGNLTSHLKVTVRYVEPTANVHIDDIANEDYCNANNNDDVVRIFPIVGYRDKDGARTLLRRGYSTSYSSMDIGSQASDGSHVIYRFGVTSATAYVTPNLSTYHGFAVRPFSNE